MNIIEVARIAQKDPDARFQRESVREECPDAYLTVKEGNFRITFEGVELRMSLNAAAILAEDWVQMEASQPPALNTRQNSEQ